MKKVIAIYFDEKLASDGQYGGLVYQLSDGTFVANVQQEGYTLPAKVVTVDEVLEAEDVAESQHGN